MAVITSIVKVGIDGGNPKREVITAHSGLQEEWQSDTFGFGGAGEDIVTTLNCQHYREVSIVHRNGEAGGGQDVTIRVYVSNTITADTVLATMQGNADEVSGGMITGAGLPNAIDEALTAVFGVDYAIVLARYRWVYITAESAGVTASNNQVIESKRSV